jgi:hypothetical protein
MKSLRLELHSPSATPVESTSITGLYTSTGKLLQC